MLKASPVKTFTPPPIAGYRVLTEQEVALINRVKRMGVEVEAVVNDVRDYVFEQGNAEGMPGEELARLTLAEPERWSEMARGDLQTGFMKLVRAIAQPSGF
jgi:hypothetical protein